MLFLIAERLRNLGTFTFAAAVSYRLEQPQIRITAALGTLAITLLFLIAQIIDAGKLIAVLNHPGNFGGSNCSEDLRKV